MDEKQGIIDLNLSIRELREFIEDVVIVFSSFHRFLGDGPEDWAKVFFALEGLTPSEIVALCETYKEIKNQA